MAGCRPVPGRFAPQESDDVVQMPDECLTILRQQAETIIGRFPRHIGRSPVGCSSIGRVYDYRKALYDCLTIGPVFNVYRVDRPKPTLCATPSVTRRPKSFAVTGRVTPNSTSQRRLPRSLVSAVMGLESLSELKRPVEGRDRIGLDGGFDGPCLAGDASNESALLQPDQH